MAYLSSPKAVNEFLEKNKENINHVIKQNLAVGDIFKRENLQVHIFAPVPFSIIFKWLVLLILFVYIHWSISVSTLHGLKKFGYPNETNMDGFTYWIINETPFTRFPFLLFVCFVLQFSTEELVKEVKNSIAEFESHNQEYDEERVKEQVSTPTWYVVY